MIAKDLNLSSIKIGDYYKNKYGLWLDFRMKDDNSAHSSSCWIGDSCGIKIQVMREAKTQGNLRMYVFLVMDAQLSVENSHFKDLDLKQVLKPI